MKEITKENKDILEALSLMWEQYCPPPYTHKYMSAGEQTEVILQEYGLLNGKDEINWDLLTS